MVLINPEFEKALVSFINVKGLDPKTQSKYLEFYHKFANIYGEIDTKSIDNFLKNNRSSPARAMIKNLLISISRWDLPLEIKDQIGRIDVPKVTGKIARKKPQFITREQVIRLTEGINKDNELVDGRTRIMMLVQFWGGLRLEELIGITIEDLRIESYNHSEKFKSIKIRSETAKFKKERDAYIPNNVYRMLIEWLRIRERYESLQGRLIKETESIWGIGANRYRHLVNKWTQLILGRRYNTHSFRHGRGTDLRKIEKWDIQEIKEYLGHSDISSTQLYVHLSGEDIKNRLEE